MKRCLTLLVFIMLLSPLKAQINNINIAGKVYDNAIKEVIEHAGIRILNIKDSTYVSGAATNEKGEFSIAVRPNRYIVQITYIGYNDVFVDTDARKGADIGNIYLEENDILLKETVVEAKAVEIRVKGDTLEYNADSYKVQESAVVEDLLKKMPGVEIDSDGKITVNGKEVKKFLVDGKEFFSDDPKVASKNLPAKMVDKLQVVDRKSDMSQMTGFDDGEEETIINLTVKPGMKEGLFGNAFVGYGSKDKYEANGMVNYMRNNTQISVLGGANNTNNAGFSDFSSNMFGGRGPGRMSFGGNNGITKSANGGLNFATEHSDKLKWGGDVRYGNTNNDVETTSITNYTTKEDPRSDEETSWGNNKSDNFGANLRFEWTPDSLTKIIFRPSFQYNTNSNLQKSEMQATFYNDPTKGFNTVSSYDSHGKGYKLNGNLDMSRKLSSHGRVLSLGLSGGLDKSDSDGFDYSLTKYLVSEPDSIIDQQFFEDNKSNSWKAFLSYVEPLGRRNFLQLSYSIRGNNSETDKIAYNKDSISDGYTQISGTDTRYVKNEFVNQNVSLSFKAVREKYNYTIGLGLEPSYSKTTVYEPNGETENQPGRNFLSFAPSGQFNYMWDKRHNLRIDYSGTTNQPTTAQLYDGIYSHSGMNTTYGNPNLRPSFENSLRIRYRKFNPEQASFMMLYGRFNHVSDAIVRVVTNKDMGGKDINYQNIDGNMDGNLRFVYNTPLRNKKFSINSMTYATYSIENTYIDSLKNKSNVLRLQENLGLQFRSDKFDFGVRGNVGYTNQSNTLSTRNDQSVFNYGGRADFTWYLPFDFTLESDMEYLTNSGYSDGFKQKSWLWNASLGKQVFKDKSGTVRLKMYDILKERSNISRVNDPNYIRDQITNSISSYLMVHFVYKFQIFKGGAKSADMDGAMRGRGQGRGSDGGQRF